MTWSDCLPLETEFAGVHPANLTGVVRVAGSREVACIYAPDGKYRGLFPLDHAKGLLADEAGAAYLRGELPAKAIPAPPYNGWGDEVQTMPYSGPLTVLVVSGIESLAKATVWAHRREQIVRFGGMPVLATLEDPAPLSGVPWREGDSILVMNETRAEELPPVPVAVEVLNA